VREDRRRRGLAGVVAGAFALGTSEFLAGVSHRFASLIGAVGDAVIELAPGSVVRLAIESFGTNDKTVLAVGIVGISLAAASWAGRAAARRFRTAAVCFAGFGALGVLAVAYTDRGPVGGALFSAVLSAGAGLGVLAFLSALLRPRSLAERSTITPIGIPNRREFLAVASAFAGGALALAVVGNQMTKAAAMRARRLAVLPSAARRVPRPTAAHSVGVAGVAPIVVPNDDFYRIDTRFFGAPLVDLDGWRLRITGMVDRPYELTWDELTKMEMVDSYVTLCCVSNEVGDDLIGNAVWRGVPLASLLERAGVHPDADQIVGRSVDGFTAGFPTSAAFDGRTALLAIGMNGEVLPIRHGWPARLVVAGLYGYVSATKWLEEIELTTFDAYDAYWIPRGWAQRAPVKTQSRIDTVVPRHPTADSPLTGAGVAWAPGRGISKVEVQVDDAPFAEARLAEALSDETWRQWAFTWQATAGSHLVRVRATDGRGETQTADISPPAPDGATGYHTIRVQVGSA